MAMKKRYYTVAGEIVGERDAEGRLDYLPDALGSVIATVDEAGVVQRTARYKPYGSVLASSGDPITYGWVGTQGYRRTGLTHADYYMRARIYASSHGSFLSPLHLALWFTDERKYSYGNESPINFIDPTGYAPCEPPKQCTPSISVKPRTKACSARLKTSSGYPEVCIKFFIYVDIVCTLSCEESDCGSCLAWQEVTDKLIVDGSVVGGTNKHLDPSHGGDCPGSIRYTDAPGIHSGRRTHSDPPGKIGERCGHPPFGLLVFNGIYKATCICGSKRSQQTWTMAVRIEKKKAGGYKCGIL